MRKKATPGMIINRIDMNKTGWIGGVSDGLTLPCSVCGEKDIKFDYSVGDCLWNQVVSEKMRRDVICLSCLDKMCYERGIDISGYLISVQFCGIGKTIELLPSKVYLHSESEVGNESIT